MAVSEMLTGLVEERRPGCGGLPGRLGEAVAGEQHVVSFFFGQGRVLATLLAGEAADRQQWVVGVAFGVEKDVGVGRQVGVRAGLMTLDSQLAEELIVGAPPPLASGSPSPFASGKPPTNAA
ncbi:hypothetical protein [Streptomyces sp. NPDC001889]